MDILLQKLVQNRNFEGFWPFPQNVFMCGPIFRAPNRAKIGQYIVFVYFLETFLLYSLET